MSFAQLLASSLKSSINSKMDDSVNLSESSEDSPPKSRRRKGKRKSLVDGLHGLLKKKSSSRKSSKERSRATDESDRDVQNSSQVDMGFDDSEMDFIYTSDSAVSSVVSEPASSPEAARFRKLPNRSTVSTPSERSPDRTQYQKIWDLDAPSIEVTCCPEPLSQPLTEKVIDFKDIADGVRHLMVPPGDADRGIMTSMPCHETGESDEVHDGDGHHEVIDKMELSISWMGVGLEMEVSNLETLTLKLPTETNPFKFARGLVGGWADAARNYSDNFKQWNYGRFFNSQTPHKIFDREKWNYQQLFNR